MHGMIDTDELLFPHIVEQPVMWGYYRNMHDAADYKALVDDDTGKVFSLVSRSYQVIRHEEAIDQVEAALYTHPELGPYTFTTEFYNDGGRMRRQYTFPDIAVKIDAGDVVNLQIHLFNSYDVTWPFIVILGALRLVCTNGLVIGNEYFLLRKRHVAPLEALNIEEQVSTAIERFEFQSMKWKAWAQHPLTEKAYYQVMSSMQFGKKASEEIGEQIAHQAAGFDDNGIPIMSVWLFYNVLTWYITHKAVSLNHRVEMEKRLRTAIRVFPRKKN